MASSSSSQTPTDTADVPAPPAAQSGTVAPRCPTVLCAVQDSPQSFDLPASLDRLETLTRDAGKRARDDAAARWGAAVRPNIIVTFPEGFLSAYPRGMDFGSPIGSRSAEGRSWYRRYFESSMPVCDADGWAMRRIRQAARENEVTLVVGVIERCNAEITGTVITISPQGKILSSRRKLQPTGLERLVWSQGSRSDIRVAKTPLITPSANTPAAPETLTIASTICWEAYMAKLRLALYDLHPEVWCAPTADARSPQWLSSMTHIALEGRVFVVSCCQYAERKDYPADYPAKIYEGMKPQDVVTRGGSVIVSPLGQVLAGPLWDERGILTACVDDIKGDIIEAKMDLDVCGHYARSDIFGS